MEKEDRLRALCSARRLDGVLLSRRANVAWLTDGADVTVDSGSALGVAALLWTPRTREVLTNVIEARRLRDEEPFRGWTIRPTPWWAPRARPAGRLGSDWPLPGTVPVDLADLRAPLTAREVARTRALGAECGSAVGRLAGRLRRGWTEHRVAAELSRDLLAAGIRPVVVLVAADERIARYRHPIPTSTAINRMVMVVLCAQRHGLIVCLTRLVHFGKPPRDLRRRHDAVVRVDAELQRWTHPGVRWCDLLARARSVYRETGFAKEWTLHHQGGPMGYECRDFLATPAETRRVEPRQAVGWNPSITGTKSEDTVLSGDLPEVLTASPGWPMLDVDGWPRPDILVRR